MVITGAEKGEDVMSNDATINLIILNGLNSGVEVQGEKLYPSPFIVERINALRNEGIFPKTIITHFIYPKTVQLAYQMINGKPLHSSSLYTKEIYDKENIHVVSTNWSLIATIYVKILAKKASKKILKEINPTSNTLLHVHWSYPHGYIGMLVAKKLEIPYIITTHGGDINEGAATSRRRRKYIMTALNNASHCIFVSQDSLNNAISYGFNGNSASVIPNGVDLSRFHPISKELSSEKTSFHQTKKYVVGFIGRLHHHKRADKLPEIFKMIMANNLDVEFIVIGTGPMSSDIQNQCTLNNIPVTFVDWVEHGDVMFWMNLFDVMILPSRTEGWPCVILEAFSCGVPIVASDAGGIPEAMGGLGLIVPSGKDFEQRFGDAVSKCLYSLADIDKHALIEYAKRYTWEYTVSKEIEIYQEQLRNIGE
ncbi:MAG: glycosyltransferase family 4 protein [Methanocorpusculum parvum]|nr:glycosyltransferase family 4 protein [Methanocorpusculum parvum]